MREIIKSFLSDGADTLSMTKLLTAIAVIIPLFVWLILCIIKWQLLDIPIGVATVILSGLGIKVTEKIFTK